MGVARAVTALFLVPDVEPAMGFWRAVGLEPVGKARDSDGVPILAILSGGGATVMLRARDALAAEAPAVAAQIAAGGATVYVTVDDVSAALNAIREETGPAQVLIPRKSTPWGMDEVCVRGPGGAVVVIAADATGGLP